MKKDYSDIINLPRHISVNRPQMTRKNRASQFAPFAALTGFGEAIIEEARLTKNKKELTKEKKDELDYKISILNDNKDLEATYCYFIKDNKKTGGFYEKTCSKIKKIDEIKRIIHLTNGTKIYIDDLIEIYNDIFSLYDL